MVEPEELVLGFDVAASPERLEQWWTDLPEVYEAEDPREQPHRIERLATTEDGAVYETEWRGPMGLTFTLEETLHDEGPGRWRFVVPGPGFEIVDRYEVTATETGAHLEIRSTISYDHLPGKLAQRVMIPNWKQMFTEVFSDAVAVFEEHRAGEAASPTRAST